MSPDWETLYVDLPTGFQTPTVERDAVDAAGGEGAGTYGEVTPESTRTLLRWIEPAAHDLLLDLGSGTGRLLVQAVCETPIGSAHGLEMAPHRHAIAERARDRLRHLAPAAAARIGLQCADFTRSTWPDATIVWIGATCFPDALTAAAARRALDLPALRLMLLTRPLPDAAAQAWCEVGRLDLPMSWLDRVGVHVYRPRR